MYPRACFFLIGALTLAPCSFAQTPQISGAVNAANYQPAAAPGGLISIFGSNLATGTASAQALPLPGSLLGTTVSINGIPAPLLYVSAAQINAQVPYEVQPDASASIMVQTSNGSASSTLNVQAAAPALFTISSTGSGSGAILNTNYSLVMDNNPAQPGQIVQIYATGLGMTSPAVVTGAGGGAQPLPSGVTVTVTIGGMNAPVAFAGAAWGFAGLDQLNVTVPNAATGAQSVVITVGGASSTSSATINVVSNTPSPGLIGPTYFGMALSTSYFAGTQPWPNIPFTTIRTNDNMVSWMDLEPSPGIFDFTLLDQVLNGGATHGLIPNDYILTMVKTPTWASSNPTATGCSDYKKRTGGCFAPIDVNADGTGTDALWQAYITALLNHVCPTPDTCKIQYFEGWNEPNNPLFWEGTTAQLVRMQQDAYKLIKKFSPSLTVVSPSVAPGGSGSIPNGVNWMNSFLAAGARDSFDIMGFHGYLAGGAPPEGIATMVTDWTTLLSSQGLSQMPLWDTEGSWGEQSNLTDPDQQTAFLARYYLLQSAKTERFYWYSYNNNYGTLESSNVLTQAGTAYGYLYHWMTGATVDHACTNAGGSVWTCSFTRPGGYQALAVWDASKICISGVCNSSSYSAPAGFVQYRDLAGNVVSIKPNASVAIGAKPILLENQNP